MTKNPFTILMVAEKPSLAQSIAHFLADGQVRYTLQRNTRFTLAVTDFFLI